MGKMQRRASFSVILLKSLSLMKRRLWGFSSRRIRIRHDNWDGTIFSTLSPIFAQLSFLPNLTNSIKCPKNRPPLWKHSIFFVTCDFLSFHAHPLIPMCCMEKVGWLFCFMKDGTCFKLFYCPIFYLAVRVRSFNSTTIMERLNSCTTKIIQCAPRLIHVKSYNLKTIFSCGTTAQNVQCERKVLICADICWFFFLRCWYFTFSTWSTVDKSLQQCLTKSMLLCDSGVTGSPCCEVHTPSPGIFEFQNKNGAIGI